MNPNNPIFLFDGHCKLCNRSAQFIIKHDKHKKFLFEALGSGKGKELLKKYAIPENPESLVFIVNNKAWLRSTAVLKIMKALGGVWSLFYIFILVPRPIRDLCYSFVAKIRYRLFGKSESCMTPSL